MQVFTYIGTVCDMFFYISFNDEKRAHSEEIYNLMIQNKQIKPHEYVGVLTLNSFNEGTFEIAKHFSNEEIRAANITEVKKIARACLHVPHENVIVILFDKEYKYYTVPCKSFQDLFSMNVDDICKYIDSSNISSCQTISQVENTSYFQQNQEDRIKENASEHENINITDEKI